MGILITQAFEGGIMLVLISGDRLSAAVSRADIALISGERISKRLVDSLALLRTSRDELSAKLQAATEKEEPPLMEKSDWLTMI
jgi:hypothetical protein